MSNSSNIYNLIEAIAADLVVDACFVEKDWYAMRIIGVLSTIDHPKMQLVFSGGTSLSKAFGIIKRFSEDLDFKVQNTGSQPSRKERRIFREQIIETLTQGQTDWKVDQDSIEIGDGSKFFKVPIQYKALFNVAETLRPYVQLEVTFQNPVLLPESKPLQSFVRKARKQKPESSSFPCISPVETAADKLSALAWRIKSRDRNNPKDDPTLIRHLHDLAALENSVSLSSDFVKLVKKSLEKDSKRIKKEHVLSSQKDYLDSLVMILETDPLYRREYEKFVQAMSYAEDKEELSFEEGMEALRRIVALF